MRWKAVNSSMPEINDKESAITLLDFLIWQYNRASTDEIHAKYSYDSAISANNAVKNEYYNNPDYVGLGMGPQLPYNEFQIECRLKELKECSEDLKEIKAILDFVKRKIIGENYGEK